MNERDEDLPFDLPEIEWIYNLPNVQARHTNQVLKYTLRAGQIRDNLEVEKDRRNLLIAAIESLFDPETIEEAKERSKCQDISRPNDPAHFLHKIVR